MTSPGTDNSGALHWYHDCPDRVNGDRDHADDFEGLRADLARSLSEVTCTRCYGDAVRQGLIIESTDDDPPWT